MAAAVLACIAVRELVYRQQHRFHAGPSLTIAALAAVCAVAAGTVAWALADLHRTLERQADARGRWWEREEAPPEP